MTTSVNYFNFIKGLNTEANPLSYPPDTLKDADNVILLRDGSIRRRKGIDYEQGNVEHDIPFDYNTSASRMFLWKAVAGQGDLEFAVLQLGAVLWFLDASATALSSTPKSFSIDLNGYAVCNSLRYNRCEFASGKGKLFVTNPCMNPIYVEYDSATDSISVATVRIKIRDFEDLEPNVLNDLRPATLTKEHAYWLRNAGWLPTYTVDGVDDDPITFIYSRANVYPSKADVIHAGKKSDDDGDPMLTWTTLNAQTFGNTPAAQGHYIVDAFNIDRSGISEYPAAAGIPVESTPTRPGAVAFMAGRVFFAGVTNSDKVGNVYFSQVIEHNRNISRCYQEQDPTSEEFNELVDTDGGVITIPESGPIVKLATIKDSVLVFANNGIWQISGVDQHFTAKSYRIFKISDEGVFSPRSIMIANSDIFYISESGIVVIQKDQVSEDLRPNNLSYNTVQSWLNDLPLESRKRCSAGFDTYENRLYFMFPNTSTYNNAIEKILVYDLTLGAFYPLSLSLDSTTPRVYDAIFNVKRIPLEETLDVYADGDEVVVNGLPVVVTLGDSELAGALNMYLLTRTPAGNMTISTFNDFDLMDWESELGTGVAYNSFFETGYEILQDATVPKQLQYLTAILRRTETGFSSTMEVERPSSCLLTVKWDWSSSAVSNKWSRARQVYRYNKHFTPANSFDDFDTGFEVISTRNKIPGRGRSVRFRFESEEDKDFHVHGWQVFFNSRGAP